MQVLEDYLKRLSEQCGKRKRESDIREVLRRMGLPRDTNGEAFARGVVAYLQGKQVNSAGEGGTLVAAAGAGASEAPPLLPTQTVAQPSTTSLTATLITNNARNLNPTVAAAGAGASEAPPLLPTQTVAQPSTTSETVTLITDAARIRNLTVRQLKDQCRIRGIPVSGNKTELQEKLLAYVPT
ncbi:hypothetical protein CYMTET_37605 [Cymbomonas tetramitiformis]|uniref:SAP domain-containing protein n=1 Tax=Cymbomonas tetramitiformis TaxID=36881 RepID=A0AAE0CFY8_9CHLO|nr:hypothetical protein CYMTET_37605 [Cymbomonas tetramitiformis]